MPLRCERGPEEHQRHSALESLLLYLRLGLPKNWKLLHHRTQD